MGRANKDESLSSEHSSSVSEFDLVKVLAELPVGERRVVYALKAIQSEYDALMDEFRREVADLEMEKLKRRESQYEKRSQIINGTVELAQEDLNDAVQTKQVSLVEEIDSDDGNVNSKKTVSFKTDITEKKGIPYFWREALSNHFDIGQHITNKDKDVLAYLTNITTEFVDNNPLLGFKLSFFFSENKYLKEKVLTKTCLWKQERKGDQEEIEKLVGSKITWTLPSLNPTVVCKEKKQRHKSGKGVRIVKIEEKIDSFFNFFNPIELSPDGEPIGENAKGLDDDDIQHLISTDETITLAIQQELIHRPVFFYTGACNDQQDQFLSSIPGSTSDSSDSESDSNPDIKANDDSNCKQQ